MASMDRLVSIAQLGRGAARVDLTFGRDTSGRGVISGRIEAAVVLSCQRCMEPVTLKIEREVHLVIVDSFESALRLDPEADPLVQGEESIALSEIVEDELLLALPQEATHQTGQCATQHRWDYGDNDAATEAGESEHPFAVLAELKTRDE
ncbi:MAG: DUF177 domain-containing protein [Gammaproteobacteria bacterium]